MIAFWLAAGLLAALVVAALARPLLRRGGAEAEGRLAYDLAIYRDQLAEVERGRASGEIGEREAAASRAEIERRILVAADRAEAEGPPVPERSILAVVLALLLPVGALALYGWQGAPRLPAQPLAGRTLPAGEGDVARIQQESINALVRRLEERPDDLESWERLGRTLVRAQRFADAAEAYRHRIGLGAERADLHAAHGEALTMAAGGIVTPAAREAFARAPDDPRAMFFLGEAAMQAGDLDQAIARWTALEGLSPPDAPWRPLLRQRIAEAATRRGVPAPPPAPAGEGPPAGAVPPGGEALLRLSPEERAQAIRGMVDGLEQRLQAAPADRDGWRRLAQALRVLDDPPRLAAALTRAVAAFPEDVELHLDLANAQLEVAGGDDVLPEPFLATIRAAARLAPDHPQILWYLGRAAADAGDPAEARRLWQRLLERLPAGSPARGAVESRLSALPEKKTTAP
ncbi:c-type cytochrome biogenesis protein CcmI [Allostella vacuolata]|nr:c-type cytochrome biogenesis protein CcmI [Stella vacuolata]